MNARSSENRLPRPTRRTPRDGVALRAIRTSVVAVLFLAPACRKAPVDGGACKPSERGALVCNAKDAALECRDGTWPPVPCRGPGGCVPAKQDDPRGPSAVAMCDESVAKEGDPCAKRDRNADADHACSVERDRTLVCDAGKWVLGRPCRGPKGCSVGLDCDVILAAAGDPCDTRDVIRNACTVDRKALLECKE